MNADPRTRTAVRTCLILVLLASAGWAMPANASLDDPLEKDPEGDLVLHTDSGPQDAGDAWSALDLVGLQIDEDEAGFTFHVAFADLKSTAPPGTEAGYTRVFFEVDGNGYVLLFNRPLGTTGHRAFAFLMEYDQTQERYMVTQDLESTTDVTAGTLSATVGRNLLQDRTGAPPMQGHSFSNLWVESQAHVPAAATELDVGLASTDAPARVLDVMPDEGATEYHVRIGLPQEGHARLASPQAFRASNGEAATFIYEIVTQNTGPEKDLFRLSAQEVPDGWNVVFPTEELELDGGESRTVPVLLILPFQHSHGAVEQAVVRLESLTDDGSHASTHLGVRFLAVPQPAGHHDTLFIHSRSYSLAAEVVNPLVSVTEGEAFMNSMEEFDGDEGIPLHGSAQAASGGGTQFEWFVHLEPSLEMGLDFDVDDTGKVEVELEADRPLQGASVSGRLVLLAPTSEDDTQRFPPYGGRDATILATIEPDGSLDVSAGQRFSLTGVVTPEEAADLIPYVPGQNLVLELRVTDELPLTLGGTPALLSGSKIKLPLDEYSDPVSDLFDGFDVKILEALDVQERLANPGDGVVFDLRMTNVESRARDFTVVLRGGAVQYANLSIPETVRLDGGQSMDIQVLVHVPDGAQDGTRLDFVVDAAEAGDDARRSLVRLAVVVDEDAEHADDAASFSETEVGRDSPGAPLALLLGALAGAAVALRRRD